MQENSTSPPQARPNKGQFSLGRVVAVSVFAVLIFGGIFVFFGLMDGWQKIQEMRYPEIVPASGSVVFDGQPLQRGTVVTESLEGNLPTGIGFIDETGKFTLKTDLPRGRVEGAFVGKHKIAIQAQRTDVRLGAFAPPSLVPDQYASIETTPLTIEVKAAGGTNEFQLEVPGDESHRANPSSLPAAAGGAGGEESATKGKESESKQDGETKSGDSKSDGVSADQSPTTATTPAPPASDTPATESKPSDPSKSGSTSAESPPQ